MHPLPGQHGFVIARPESHAVLFLQSDGSWTDDPAFAKVVPSQIVAFQHQRRHPGASVVGVDLIAWLQPPRIRVARRPVARR